MTGTKLQKSCSPLSTTEEVQASPSAEPLARETDEVNKIDAFDALIHV